MFIRTKFLGLYITCVCYKNVLYLLFSVGSEISKDPHDVTTVEGQGVVLSCSVKGHPSPNVRWTKNGERLNIAANPRLNVSQTNNIHSLIITDVHRSDAGQYGCVAYNSLANTTSSAATLEVYCKYQNQLIL